MDAAEAREHVLTIHDLRLAIADLYARPRVQVITRAAAQYLVLAGAHAALGVLVEHSKAAFVAALQPTEPM